MYNYSKDAYEGFLAGRTTDWEDMVFRVGFRQDYNASISGASERVNYYLSFGYLHNEGVTAGDQYKSFRSNIKVNGKVTDWLEIGANVNFQDRSDGGLSIDLKTEQDPYSYVTREIPAEGSEESYTLSSGCYIVGVHIPEGIYQADMDDDFDVWECCTIVLIERGGGEK